MRRQHEQNNTIHWTCLSAADNEERLRLVRRRLAQAGFGGGWLAGAT